MQEYTVSYRGRPVGKVVLEKEGLYFSIICHCCTPEKGVFRLQATIGAEKTNLGVLLPEKEGYSLRKKVPVKIFGGDNPSFCLISGKNEKSTRFVPIYPEEPFSYIERLKEAFFARQNAQAGICLK